MNVSNLVLDEKFSNTIPLSLPEGCLVDVAQLVGIVPVSKGGTGADNISDASNTLQYVRKDISNAKTNAFEGNGIVFNNARNRSYNDGYYEIITKKHKGGIGLNDGGSIEIYACATEENEEITETGVTWDTTKGSNFYIYMPLSKPNLYDRLYFHSEGTAYRVYGEHNLNQHYHGDHVMMRVPETGQNRNVLYIRGLEGQTNGAELYIEGGGNTYVSSGEAASNYYTYIANKEFSDTEHLYLLADSAIYFCSNVHNVYSDTNNMHTMLFNRAGDLIVPIVNRPTVYKCRNIALNTSACTANSTKLNTGYIYCQYS